MNRTVKRAAVLLTTLGMAFLPGASIAEAHDIGPIVVNNNYQVAGDDLYNVGHAHFLGGGPMGGGPGVPTGSQMVDIQTRFDRVQLVEHTGDATFAPFLDYNYSSRVSYSEQSTATYRGQNTDYIVNLSASASGMPQASCDATARDARCQVQDTGYGLIVTMG